MVTLLGLVLTITWLGALYLCYLIWLGGRRPRRALKKKPRRHHQRSSSGFRLNNRLLTLLNGDFHAAERLIVYTRNRHPNRPLNWCLEKTIHDLERDRR